MTVKTYGLTHCALAVRDPHRSASFYAAVFGAVVVFDQPDFVPVQTPGCRDVLVFERDEAHAGRKGGVLHVGFRLLHPGDIEIAAQAVTAAGGQITSRGEFCPGEPYLFFRDPDGYEVEIWYELPTPVDLVIR
ncbi:MAG: VOC family protein [Acidobacteriota bacterium]